MLPMNLAGVKSRPVSKPCPCENGYTWDSFQSSGMPKTMQVLFKKLNLNSIDNVRSQKSDLLKLLIVDLERHRRVWKSVVSCDHWK